MQIFLGVMMIKKLIYMILESTIATFILPQTTLIVLMAIRYAKKDMVFIHGLTVDQLQRGQWAMLLQFATKTGVGTGQIPHKLGVTHTTFLLILLGLQLAPPGLLFAHGLMEDQLQVIQATTQTYSMVNGAGSGMVHLGVVQMISLLWQFGTQLAPLGLLFAHGLTVDQPHLGLEEILPLYAMVGGAGNGTQQLSLGVVQVISLQVRAGQQLVRLELPFAHGLTVVQP